jgi:hypothetical protein
MKLDKDPFPVNMNIIELDGKKVLVQPSQAESTKGKDIIVGDERPPRIIKPKSMKGAQWQKNEGGGASRNNTQKPPSTFSWLSIRKAGPASGVARTGPSIIANQTVRFPWVRPAHLQPGAHSPAPYFLVGPPMPEPWGPPPMVYPPCPPWAGWYGPWAPSSMPFHPGWSGPTEGFGFVGFYAGDGRCGHVGHQQDRGALG